MPRDRLPLLVCTGLVVLTLLAYGPVWRNDFVDLDDEDIVLRNQFVKNGFSPAGIRWAWTTFFYGNWIPLTWMSLQLDGSLTALLQGSTDPLGPSALIFHGQNLFWHIATVVLLFVTLRRLTGALWRSALVAALFAVHPLHVESVAWVTERKDVLSTFFLVLALLAYGSYSARPTLARYLLVTGCFVLGLLAKPMLVTLPCALLLLDWWPLQRWQTQARSASEGIGQESHRWRFGLVGEKVPWLAISAVFCLVAMVAQKHSLAVRDFPLADRLTNAVISCAWYLEKTFWPTGLAPYYYHPRGNWQWPTVLLAAAVVAGVTTLAIIRARRWPWLLVGWLWFLGTLVPVIGLVQVGDQARADRYTYVPHLGLLVALVWSAAALADRLRLPVGLRAGLATTCLVLLAAATWVQVGHWRNPETLWTHAVAATPGNPYALYCRGRVAFFLAQPLNHSLGGTTPVIRRLQVSLGRDQPGDDRELLERARAYYEQALAFEPEAPTWRAGFILVLIRQGHFEQAAEVLQQMLPGETDPRWCLRTLATVQRRLGLLEEARKTFQRLLQLSPDLADARAELGLTWWQMGRRDQAEAQWLEALRHNPREPIALNGLGSILLRQGKNEMALEQFLAAAQANPGLVEACRNQGIAHGRLGQWSEASQCLQRAAARLNREVEDPLGPGLAERISILCYLAMSLHAQGLPAEAAARYAEASQQDPHWPGTNLARAWRLATQADAGERDPATAWELATQACQASPTPSAEALDALAAALAALGRFPEAVQTAQRALATVAPERAEAIQARLALYQKGQAFVCPSEGR